jgi:hypothetical protein
MLLLFSIKSAKRLPQNPAGNPPHFYQGNPKVMILEELMTLDAVHQEYRPMAIYSR